LAKKAKHARPGKKKVAAKKKPSLKERWLTKKEVQAVLWPEKVAKRVATAKKRLETIAKKKHEPPPVPKPTADHDYRGVSLPTGGVMPKGTSASARLVIFPTPLSALCEVTHDAGWSVVGVDATDDMGRAGQAFTIPAGTPSGHGARLTLTADGMVPIEQRGLLVHEDNRWLFYADDFHMQPLPEAPEPEPAPEPPGPGESPEEIIAWVWASGEHQLVTKEGCGKFTEACCAALHEGHYKAWGHIRKNEGQNQWNGHAVDAVMLAANAPDGTSHGIYDIIQSSESAEAQPVFNYAGPSDPNLWYYPA